VWFVKTRYKFFKTGLPMRILIVDDAPDIREILEIILGGDGWEVTTAESLAQANAQLNLGVPDIVLLDFQLPDGDGMTAGKSWKDDSRFSHLPIVLYTGSEKQTEPGVFADVILKNIDPFELSKRLQTLLK
jgi:DNA-binding response OmpR family regulator